MVIGVTNAGTTCISLEQGILFTLWPALELFTTQENTNSASFLGMMMIFSGNQTANISILQFSGYKRC